MTEFDRKWVRGGAPEGESLVGSADIQSLADLANSFEVIQTMRLVPFGKEAVIQLVLAVALPIVPLLLTMFRRRVPDAPERCGGVPAGRRRREGAGVSNEWD